MNTLKEPQVDHVFYTKNPDDGFPKIKGYDEAEILAGGTRADTYLLAPVAKVVEVEIPGETKPVEPYVGMEWRDVDGDLWRVLTVYNHPGDGELCFVAGCSSGGSWVTDYDTVGGWLLSESINYPTVTTPPRTEKRLVMLNGWTRNGFGEAVVSESGGTTDER